MRDILDEIVTAAVSTSPLRLPKLLSIARERIAAGDDLAGEISSGEELDRRIDRHAAAKDACEKEVKQHD